MYWSSGATTSPPTAFTEANTRTPNPACTTSAEGSLIGTQIRELAAQPMGGGQVFAGGDSRTVWFRDPGPGVWVARDVPIIPAGAGGGGWGWHAMTSVAYDRVTNRLYVGDRFRVQVSLDNGGTFAAIGPTFPGEITEIGVAPDRPPTQTDSTLLLGTTAGIYRSVNGGSIFTPSPPAVGVGPANVANFTFHRFYSPTGDHTVFAAVEGTSSGFFLSLDPSDGAGWSPALNSGLPPANPGLTIVGHEGGSVLYAGSGSGNLGGVYRSEDLGATWTLPVPLTGLAAKVFGLAVATVGGTEVVHASTRGGVLRSGDGGVSWTGYSGGIANTRCGALRLSPVGAQQRLFVGTEGRGVYVTSAPPN